MMRHDVLLIFSQSKFTRPSHPHAETYRQEVFQCYSGQMGESSCQSKIHNLFIALLLLVTSRTVKIEEQELIKFNFKAKPRHQAGKERQDKTPPNEPRRKKNRLLGFPTRSYTNQSVQQQKMVRSLKF